MHSITIKAELKAIRNEVGGYIIYVFRNLEPNCWTNQYVMTVRFPHWESPLLQVGDVGFLSYKEVTAGEDFWWDKITNNKIAYNYDNIIFVDFIREKPDTVLLA